MLVARQPLPSPPLVRGGACLSGQRSITRRLPDAPEESTGRPARCPPAKGGAGGSVGGMTRVHARRPPTPPQPSPCQGREQRACRVSAASPDVAPMRSKRAQAVQRGAPLPRGDRGGRRRDDASSCSSPANPSPALPLSGEGAACLWGQRSITRRLPRAQATDEAPRAGGTLPTCGVPTISTRPATPRAGPQPKRRRAP